MQKAPNPYLPPKEVEEDSFKITYQSLISIVTEGLKLLGLANGGAAIALLAYLGPVAKAGLTPNLVLPMIFLATGLTACIVAFFAGYFCQMYRLKYWSLQDENWMRRYKLGFLMMVISVLLSIVGFFGGVVLATMRLAG